MDAASKESTIKAFIEEEATNTSRKRREEGKFGPLPLVIGIAGHRDLNPADTPKLESILTAELLRLRKLHPSTPFVILSALADGADRIGAKVAIALGYRLIVPLPMPSHLYETDFDEPSLKEFRELIGCAEHSFAIPLVHPEAEVAVLGPARDRQYAQLGAYLAIHSEIVIAIWNGLETHLPGGSSQVVQFKLHGVPEPLAERHSMLDAPDSGVVVHIVAPRLSNHVTIGDPFTLEWKYPPGFETIEESAKAYNDIYERMETFNRDALAHDVAHPGEFGRSREYLFPTPQFSKVTERLTETADFYSIADTLAQRFQVQTVFTLRILLTFVFLAALCYDLYSHEFDEVPIVMAGYLLMFFFAFLWHRRADKAAFQTKYLDYRAVAEGLRVQFFWKLAGVRDSVADYYMRKQKSELDWIRNAVRSSMTETYADSADDSAIDLLPIERMRLVLKHWVDNQATYFARAAHRDHERLHKLERIISALFTLTLVLAGVQILLRANPEIIMAIGLLPVLAALIHTFSQKNAFAEHSKQYDRMSAFYHRAGSHLKELLDDGKIDESREFISELGREALFENGDWILTHRERPLEVPKGG